MRSSEKWRSTWSRARRASASRALAPSERAAPIASRERVGVARRDAPAGALVRRGRRGASTVSGTAPRSETTTGVPMACASTAERPKASGSVEGTVTTDAAEEGRRHVGAMADTPHDALQPRGGDQRVELAHVGRPALRVAREHKGEIARALNRCIFAAASISTFWPFHPVSRAASSTIALMRRHPPGPAKGLDPLGRDRGRGENGKIGAPVDHPDRGRRPEDRPSGSGPPCSASSR